MGKSILPYGRNPVAPQILRQTQTLSPQLSGVLQTPGIDLRTEYNNFMDAYGQQVILQHINLHVHCSQCWNEKLGEGNPQCPYCLGTGYQSVIERHTSRRTSSLSEHRTQLIQVSSPGDEIIDELFWFFAWNVNPREADMIYEVTWSDPGMTLVDHLLAAYQVTYSYPFRASGGRLEFWRTSCLSKPIDRDLIGQHLRRLGSTEMTVSPDGIIQYGMGLGS